ncbi:MAG: helix-turn-helix transcriptional regulator [Povalibacter sp.]
MITNDDRTLALADAFHSAALNPSGWYAALDALADATGSRGGELICLGRQWTMPLHIMTNVDPSIDQAFIDCGGGNPDINPRVRAGMQAPCLKVLAEADFITPDEHARHHHYQEFARPWDIPYICLTSLERTEDLLVGLAVVRSEKQGHITTQEREVFTAVAPHVRAAVRTHMALQNNAAKVLAGAMEAMSIAAFVCDSAGRVRALSPAAEKLVQTPSGLQLRFGRLQADDASEAQALNDAIAAASLSKGGADSKHQTLVIRRKQADSIPVVVEIMSLPRLPHEFTFAPRVLVVVRGTRRTSERKAEVMRSTFNLTSAEADIALQLAAGRTPELIAGARGVSVGTVRAQIKSTMSKMGVRRQIELVARLNQM